MKVVKIVSSLDDAWMICGSNLDAISFFQRGWYGSGLFSSICTLMCKESTCRPPLNMR